ncbi:peptidase S41 [Erythrobacter sp. SCSIO 43205]|uniref:S41 family peptidase n=1 Tax=Erythrobacter sp. SCSIO 43205 TaxID=2779361 RepID=UPI001CA9DAAB|nr:S41 family peptidase [Erythrobacter sp. SCSIO 43205]UAB77776.1 peptidase S41 [Erythrobacter sp. SCSIO 43205]
MSFSPSFAGRTALTATLALALAACGGGSSAPPIAGPAPTPAPAPSPTPAPTACAISEQIAFADDVLNDWYLFPNLLDNTVNQASFSTVQSFLDARVAPARAANRDQGFTFATSIAEENALINSGSSAGFGIRLSFDFDNNRLFVLEAFENAPGFQAGIDRGTEILAIGTSSANLETVSDLMAAGGGQAVIDALGPLDAGVTRVLRFAQRGGTVIEASVAKANFSLDPVSDRYGALILQDGGRNVGYLNLRTFIVGGADDQLRDAFQLFAANNVTELILDFRYNGGGLVSIAETLGDLMGRNNVGNLFSETLVRPEREQTLRNDGFEFIRNFQSEVNALQPEALVLIGTESTASASELVTNAMLPYVASDRVALVGANTSGKPVGQFAFDLAACDLRVRAVTFRTVNANGEGEYFDGLASVMPNTCRADDDFTNPLGDPNEASISTALDFLAGRSCNAITSTSGQRLQSVNSRRMVMPNEPRAAQYQIPGMF